MSNPETWLTLARIQVCAATAAPGFWPGPAPNTGKPGWGMRFGSYSKQKVPGIVRKNAKRFSETRISSRFMPPLLFRNGGVPSNNAATFHEAGDVRCTCLG